MFLTLCKKIVIWVKTRVRIVFSAIDEAEYRRGKSATKYPFLVSRFRNLLYHTRCSMPPYAWGALCGAELAKELGVQRISVIEFGVAGGNGLVALERIAIALEKIYDIAIDVYGFDTGHGLPKPLDYRDAPYQWREGFYPMDEKVLKSAIKKAQLILGPLNYTLKPFIQSIPSPIAFVSFDLDYYSSTVDACKLFSANDALFLPRVQLYFDDIMGYSYSDFTGERLAITEFNQEHAKKKISKIYGLKYFVKEYYAMWPEQMYMLHLFDHPLYTKSEGMITTNGESLPLCTNNIKERQ